MTDQERFNNQKGMWQPLLDELQEAYDKGLAYRFIYLIKSGANLAGFEVIPFKEEVKGGTIQKSTGLERPV